MVHNDNVSHLSLDSIQAHLSTSAIGRSAWLNEVWDCIGSTNERAMELAKSGAPHGVIVAAREQTAGRGRLGRTWTSPADAGVYVSFVLRPKEKPAALPVYTLAAGVAAVQAIADVASVAVGLKWVNDLVYDGSKIGGILAELASDVTGSDNGSALVIGIGINVEFNESELPPELIGKMNWLANISGKEVDRNQLVARLAHHLEKLSFVLADDGAAEICRLWRTHAAMLGQKLKVIAGKETFEALACDIDDSGALIVEKANGEKSKLYAGEVSIRGIDGNYI